MATKKDAIGRHRSPAYPAVDLPTAIQRADEFRQYAQRSAVTVAHVLEHWGYKGESSNGMKVVAALGYYGLINDTGTGDKRKIQLTERALRILMDHEESDARAEAIIDAALSPKIYKELWELWGPELPPDAEIRSHLIFEKKFNERVVSGVIDDYRRTLGFAGLLESDTISPAEQAFSGEPMSATPTAARPTSRSAGPPPIPGTKAVEIPIPMKPWPVLTVAVPMSEEKWNLMMEMLKAMKPALVDSGNGEKNG